MVFCAWLLFALSATAAIDTQFLEQPWPKQRVRDTEVSRHAVRWREKANKREGIFTGLRFTAPLDREAVWRLSTDYSHVGQSTPGVTAVRFLEQTQARQVIEVDAKVLWKTLTLRFEVEQEPPKVMRFRLAHAAVGDYRGVCTFQEVADGNAGRRSTVVDLATWVKPARPVPAGLILVAERMMYLAAAKEFLGTCERQGAPPPSSR